MERDRKQIERLAYLIVPILFLYTTFCVSFCYDMGKNGLDNIDWLWILQTNIPGMIISINLFFYGLRKQKVSRY